MLLYWWLHVITHLSKFCATRDMVLEKVMRTLLLCHYNQCQLPASFHLMYQKHSSPWKASSLGTLNPLGLHSTSRIPCWTSTPLPALHLPVLQHLFSALVNRHSFLTDLTIPKASISTLIIMNLKESIPPFSLMYHIILISSSLMILWASCRIPNLVCPNLSLSVSSRERNSSVSWMKDITSKPATCVYPLLHFLTINIQSDPADSFS